MNWYEVEVSKQRRSDIKIVSHQSGDATCQHKLVIENYLPNRTKQMVGFFSSLKNFKSLKRKKESFPSGNRWKSIPENIQFHSLDI